MNLPINLLINKDFISLYVIVLGILFTAMGITEIALRQQSYKFWMRWFSHKLFFLHGVALVLLGFPLTFYNGKWSTFVFIVGLFMVITGPFIIIYPKKIRESFDEISAEMGEGAVQQLVLFDSAMRLVIGMVFVYCALTTYFSSAFSAFFNFLWYS
ncbi:MAG: hypothetical protein N2316_07585 [Spirochaetes bacterium]|nr:hypothetical protein [Spirochaetota bacterium]